MNQKQNIKCYYEKLPKELKKKNNWGDFFEYIVPKLERLTHFNPFQSLPSWAQLFKALLS